MRQSRKKSFIPTNLQLKNNTELPYKGISARYIIIPRHNHLPWIKSLSEFVPKDTLLTLCQQRIPLPKKKQADLDHGLTETDFINPGKEHVSSDNSTLELFGQHGRIRKWTLPKHKKCTCHWRFKCKTTSFSLCYNASSPLQTLWAVKDGTTCSQRQKSPDEISEAEKSWWDKASNENKKKNPWELTKIIYVFRLCKMNMINI